MYKGRLSRAEQIKAIVVTVFISIAALSFLIFIGAMINNQIKIGTLDRQALYQTSHKIGNKEDFGYLLETAGGRTIVEGDVKAILTVSDSRLEGSWFGIKWEQERYEKHTRTVCEGEDENRKCKTETYYEWEDYKSGKDITKEYTFLGHKLHGNISFNNWDRLDICGINKTNQRCDWNWLYDTRTTKEGTIRTRFYYIPTTFSGAMFIDIGIGNVVTDPLGSNTISFHHGSTVQDVYKQGMSDYSKVFFVIWCILSLTGTGFVSYYTGKFFLLID